MGALVEDETTRTNLHRISTRFGAGDAITEMVALQKQFGLFGPTTSLKDTFTLLDIAPDGAAERKRWFSYLDKELKQFPSDIGGMSGHDRMVKAFRDNLESSAPKPMHATGHLMDDDPRVVIRADRPVVYIPVDHIVISFPLKPSPKHAAVPARIAVQRRSGRARFS